MVPLKLYCPDSKIISDIATLLKMFMIIYDQNSLQYLYLAKKKEEKKSMSDTLFSDTFCQSNVPVVPTINFTKNLIKILKVT